jgi:hypothetical protein
MNLKQLEYFVQEPGSFSKAAVVLLIDNPTRPFKF